MVKGLPLIEKPDSLCEGCILGKKHRESFSTRKLIREKTPLEIVHLDLCEPMQIPSIGGIFYFLTFIDYYMRKTWVYFLRQKSEVFARFRQYKHLLRIKVDTTSKFWELTEVENTSQMTSFGFARSVVITNKLQQGIHLNKKARWSINAKQNPIIKLTTSNSDIK